MDKRYRIHNETPSRLRTWTGEQYDNRDEARTRQIERCKEFGGVVLTYDTWTKAYVNWSRLPIRGYTIGELEAMVDYD